MKTNKFLMTLCAAAACTFAGAQGLEDVIVEKYYVANASDAADPDAGDLAVGTVTYRIYIDMAADYKLETVFGSSNNPLSIITTTEFFNNEDRGGLTGNDLGTTFLDNGTVLLDSYVSMGAGGDNQWAVLKSEDPNGAINNSDGKLKNLSNVAGIPLRVADGLVPGTPPEVTFVPGNSIVSQLDDVNDGPSVFITDGAWAVLGGTTGPDVENRVLVAQISTDGDLTFELNVRLGAPDGSSETYVAANASGSDVQFDALSYPDVAPCSAPYPQVESVDSRIVANNVILTWSPVLGSVGCQVQLQFADGTNIGTVTIGTAEVNQFIIKPANLQPGADYRWRVRCGCSQSPLVVGTYTAYDFFSTPGGAIMQTFPNPTVGSSNVTFTVPASTEATLEVYDLSGRKVAQVFNGMAEPSSDYRFEFDGSSLPNGVYIYRLRTSEEVITEKFMIAR
jgi:hypothetical protein